MSVSDPLSGPTPTNHGTSGGGAASTAPPPDAPAARNFRGDVEGLRAIAVILVLLYHAGVSALSGGFVGVDVFFVISGFLITGQLVKELDRTGTVSLLRFYARRAKRLLPATAVVLTVTTVLVFLVFSRVRWREAGGDIVSSALYVVNWRLAGREVDYLAEDSAASPVQHFWSLAVEEQFYVIWPLLILVFVFLARRTRLRLRTSLAIGLAVVAVPSFVWSIVETENNPAGAFFVTTTRLWELAIGAAVALGAALWPRLRPRAAQVLGWTGVAVVVASGLLLTTEVAWPGYAALLPTLGTAAAIIGGYSAGTNGPVRVLGTRPARWVGALSYSLYLWHWPLIIVAQEYWDGLSVWAGLGIVAFSFLPAWLTYRYVENPFRYSTAISKQPKYALSLGANCTLVGVIAGMVLLVAVPAAAPAPAGAQGPEGASAITVEKGDADPLATLDDVGRIVPDPVSAVDDVPSLYADGCQVSPEVAEATVCEYGDPEGDTTVALVGDSKMAQYGDALDTIGTDRGWQVLVITKSSCAFSDAAIAVDGELYETCMEWNETVRDLLVEDLRPDLVLTSQRAPGALVEGEEPGSPATREAMAEGLRARWSELVEAGIPVGVVLDNPAPEEIIYECVADNPDALETCVFDRDEGIEASAAPVQRAAAEGLDGVELIDLTDAICHESVCLPVIGDVLVYRQGTHLTRTYVNTMIPELEAGVSALLE